MVVSLILAGMLLLTAWAASLADGPHPDRNPAAGRVAGDVGVSGDSDSGALEHVAMRAGARHEASERVKASKENDD